MTRPTSAPLAVLAGLLGLGAGAAAVPPPLKAELVAHVTFPVSLTHAPGDATRLFVLEKTGRVVVILNGQVLATPFLDLTATVSSYSGENGLLGLAFDPGYAGNGWFYVYYTRDADPVDPPCQVVLQRYHVTADPNVADPASVLTMLVLDKPTPSHNAGWLGFGPDGYLYLAIGDGGGSHDPGEDAQNIENLLGGIIRIDAHGDDFPADAQRNYAIPPDNPFVNGPGADELWLYGLRNPWQCRFDAVTGEFYIGDVGQSLREEIDYVPAGSPGGLNFGWDCMEATLCTGSPSCTCNAASLQPPLFELAHPTNGPAVVIGGEVYRGTAIPELVGTYLFANRFGPLYQLIHNQGRLQAVYPILLDAANLVRVTAFGTDLAGEIYLCDSAGGPGPGEILKLVRDTDCNGNGVPDEDDFASGFSNDCDGNGIPDECQLINGASPDCNGNGVPDDCDVASGDSLDLNGNGMPDECEPDCNGNGTPDFLDIESGGSRDADNNGVPDECQCRWDVDGDLAVGVTDFLLLLAGWGPNPGHPADFDSNGVVDTVDFLELLAHWGPC